RRSSVSGSSSRRLGASSGSVRSVSTPATSARRRKSRTRLWSAPRPCGSGPETTPPSSATEGGKTVRRARANPRDPSSGGPVSVNVDIDVELLKSEIKKTYASVSDEPEREFIFPTGRAWAEDLGYPPELANVPDAAVESFAGVANPWQLGRLQPGERVLDLGSGAGTDSLVAAQMVGPDGSVTGIAMTPERLAKARRAAPAMGVDNVEFVEGEAEWLPFADASLDVVVSNGVIDLIPDK